MIKFPGALQKPRMLAYHTKLKIKKNPFKFGTLAVSLVVAGFLTIALSTQASGPQKRPNIVFIQTDDQTFESLSRMPYTNSRGDWIRFDNAIINHPLCCPSRASTLTGRYSHHTGVEDLISGGNFNANSTVGTWLRQSGYKTAFIGKYLNGYPWKRPGRNVPPGWDFWYAFHSADGKYDNNSSYNYIINANGKLNKRGSQPTDYADDVLTNQAVNFIKRSRSSRQPFYLQLNLKSPHYPWTPAPRYANAFKTTPITMPPNVNESDMSDKPAWLRNNGLQSQAYYENKVRAEYRAGLSADDAVKRVFTSLQNTGQLSKTVVVFMSDNGETNGAHRAQSGKRCIYEECIKTPLLIRYPGKPGRHVKNLVSNIDLAPTFAHIAKTVPKNKIDGKSIMSLINGSTADVRTEVLLRNKYASADTLGDDPKVPSFWGLRTSRYIYAELITGEKELYDIQTDPWQLNNLAGLPQYASTQAYLADRLVKHRDTHARDPR